MTIGIGQIITWADLSATCLNSMKSVCCNIDEYKSVPAILKTGTAKQLVYTWEGSIPSSESKRYYYFYATPGDNTIPLITSDTVNNEWTAFLQTAGIDIRSHKLVQSTDFGKAMGLYMQFMAHHLKHVYCKLQILRNGDSTFSGTKYLSDAQVGTLTPKYILNGVEPGYTPKPGELTYTRNTNEDLVYNQTTHKYEFVPGTQEDSNIIDIINNCIYNPGLDNGLLNRNNNPAVNVTYLSTTAS